MMLPIADLLQLEPKGDDRFVVRSKGAGFLYGGLSMAVALRGAAATIGDAKVPMSLHASFLAGGEWAGPHELAVQRVNDSRSFATRRVELVNSGRLAVVVDVVFHRPDPGEDWSRTARPRLAPPEELAGSQLPAPVDVAEVRPAPGPPHLLEPEHPYWCRVHDLPGDPVLGACGLAFVSDYWVIATPFSKGQRAGEHLVSLTLQHTLWFHRLPADGGWWYVDCAPLALAGGRYLSRGTLQARDGTLLASFVQGGFVRPRSSPTRP